MLREGVLRGDRSVDRPRQRRTTDDVPDAERREELPEPDGEGGSQRPVEVEPLEQENPAAPLDPLALDQGDRVVDVGLVEERQIGRQVVANEQPEVTELEAGVVRLGDLDLEAGVTADPQAGLADAIPLLLALGNEVESRFALGSPTG
jgi:hypothetical protein